MIGYHYTTREAWEQIQRTGVRPAPLLEHEYKKFLRIMPSLPTEAIWVWKEKLTAEQAFLVSASLAIMRGTHNLVLLAIEYEPSASASLTCIDPRDDKANLTCKFSIGPTSTEDLPMDLIIDHVPPDNVMELWAASLLEPYLGQHKSEEARELMVA